MILDLSAAVDVYSDWIDACDAVAKDGPESPVDDGLSGYDDPTAGNERGQHESSAHRNLVSSAGGNDEAGDFVDDD